MALGKRLDQLIQQHDLSKADVADARGIRRETLSRHLSGRSEMSIGDLDEYASMLGTTVEAMLTEPTSVPILGEVIVDQPDDVIPLVEIYSSATAPRFAIWRNTKPDWYACVQSSHHYTPTSARIDRPSALHVIDRRPIDEMYVHEACTASLSVAMTTHNTCHICIVWMGPEGYKLSAAPQQSTKSIEPMMTDLIWATPVIGQVLRPDLEGIDII